MPCRLLGCLLVWMLGYAPASPNHLRCQEKIALILAGQAPPGSRVLFTKPELDAFLNEEVLQLIPGAVTHAQLEFSYGRAAATADVNLVKLLAAKGVAPGWLFAKAFEGWRPVRASARLESGGGRAAVYLERLEVSGLTIPKIVVDFLVRHFAQRYSPDMRLGEPFPLKHRIERLELTPAGFAVVLRR